jgi:hypothetical protein
MLSHYGESVAGKAVARPIFEKCSREASARELCLEPLCPEHLQQEFGREDLKPSLCRQVL